MYFIDDKAGKPVGINQHIGRRPIAAFGNSDGDLQMLQWTAAGEGSRFMLLVHHTDADREWAYSRQSKIGHLDKAMDEALKRGWTVVDMKQDWKAIYPFQIKQAHNPGDVSTPNPSVFALIIRWTNRILKQFLSGFCDLRFWLNLAIFTERL